MSDTPPSSPGLPRRDFILLPLLAALTVAVLLAGAEIAARLAFVEAGKESCSYPDPLVGARMKPNCTSLRKAAEGPMSVSRYNDKGYRTNEPAGPKPPGTLRIALMGASTAQGFKTPYEIALAPRAAAFMAQRCGRPVEIQNMGVAGQKLISTYLRVDEAAALKPDLAVVLVTPFDLTDRTDPFWLENRANPAALIARAKAGEAAAAKAPPPPRSLFDRVHGVAEAAMANSRAVLAAQHFLFQDRPRYVDMYMLHGDSADYLRNPLTPAWEGRLADLELLLGEMNQRFRAQGIPMVFALAPTRAQVALLDPGLRKAGLDPWIFDNRMKAMARAHGFGFVDALGDFAAFDRPEQLFLAVDGHMTAQGHDVVARALANGLVREAPSAFAACGPGATGGPHAANGAGR